MISSNFENTFWGLKENFWKQVYDGKYHHLGKDVFDKGLHGKQVEPGFLESARKACVLASQNLGQRVDVAFYKALNATACSHFKDVSRHEVNMDADKAGKFRNVNCQYMIAFNDRTISREEPANYDRMLNEQEKLNRRGRSSYLKEIFQNRDELEKVEDNSHPSGFQYIPVDREDIRLAKVLKTAYDKGYVTTEDIDFMKTEGIIDLAHKKIDTELKNISKELQEISKSLNITQTLATVKFYDPNIGVHYNYEQEESIETIVAQLFDEYYHTLEQAAGSPEVKEITLKAIASLFQKLEWLHPFQDGQGRTDLILLSKLLVEQGFNPAILYEPYFSSTATSDEWLEYLKQGIINWQEERKKLDSKTT